MAESSVDIIQEIETIETINKPRGRGRPRKDKPPPEPEPKERKPRKRKDVSLWRDDRKNIV